MGDGGFFLGHVYLFASRSGVGESLINLLISFVELP